MSVVTDEIRTIKSTKANHEELVKLVQKLQHRPKPGAPVGVQQLLPVPYPMPPGHMRTSNPRLARQRPGSAAPGLGSGQGVDSSGALPHAPTAALEPELREVPTEASGDGHFQPFLATSEQILVRPLPSDAVAAQHPSQHRLFDGAGGGRSLSARQQLQPPSSHSIALSARASPTVNAILNQAGSRRPASARTGGAAQVGVFAGRTERLERAISQRTGAGENAVEAKRPDMA